MRASRIVTATLALAIVAGSALGLTHGLANASSAEAVCKSAQLSYTRQHQCGDEMMAAHSDTARKEVVARYQTMIDAKVAAEQGTSLPAPTSAN